MSAEDGIRERSKHLIPANKQTKEQRIANGRKGGIMSGKSKRERKAYRETLLALLDEKVSSDSKLTRRVAIAMKVLTHLYNNPNMSDFRKLVEILGELPGQTISVTTTTEKTSVKANDFLNIQLEDKE